MSAPRGSAEIIIHLDRKLSRAAQRGKGVTLTSDQLDALTELGLLEQLSDAKAAILKDHARCRRTKAECINEEASGSTSFVVPGENLSTTIGTSGGTILSADGSAARRRARAMFG